MPNGNKCFTDQMCASYNCEGSLSGLRQGTCRAD
jgi:hypothetical protein